MFTIVPNVDSAGSILQLDDSGTVVTAPVATVETEFTENVQRLERKILEQEQEKGLEMDDDVLDATDQNGSSNGELESNKRKLIGQTLEWPFAKIAQDVREASHEALQLLQLVDIIHQSKGFELEMVPRQTQKHHTSYFNLQVNIKLKGHKVRETLEILERGVSRVARAHSRDRQYIKGIQNLQRNWRLVAPSHGKMLTALQAQEPLAIDYSYTTAGLRCLTKGDSRDSTQLPSHIDTETVAHRLGPATQTRSQTTISQQSQSSTQSNTIPREAPVASLFTESNSAEARLYQGENGILQVDVEERVPKTVWIQVIDSRSGKELKSLSLAQGTIGKLLPRFASEGLNGLTNNERLMVLAHSSFSSEVFERMRREVASATENVLSYEVLHHLNDCFVIQVNQSLQLSIHLVDLTDGKMGLKNNLLSISSRNIKKSQEPSAQIPITLADSIVLRIITGITTEMFSLKRTMPTGLLQQAADTCHHVLVCNAFVSYCVNRLPKISSERTDSFQLHGLGISFSISHAKHLTSRCRVRVGRKAALEFAIHRGVLKLDCCTGTTIATQFMQSEVKLANGHINEIASLLDRVIQSCLQEQIVSEILKAVSVLGFHTEVHDSRTSIRVLNVNMPNELLKLEGAKKGGIQGELSFQFLEPSAQVGSTYAEIAFVPLGRESRTQFKWESISGKKYQDKIVAILTRSDALCATYNNTISS